MTRQIWLMNVKANGIYSVTVEIHFGGSSRRITATDGLNVEKTIKKRGNDVTCVFFILYLHTDNH